MDNFSDDNGQHSLHDKVKNSRFYRLIETEERVTTQRYDNSGKQVSMKVNGKEYYRQEDIAAFRMDEYSKLIPEHDGYKVIMSTYFPRFWGPVFDYKEKEKGKQVRRSSGMIAYTYVILKSYCYGKDHCWISLQKLAENLVTSKNAARIYLEHLEKEGFIARFWRENEKSGEGESILIKVRQTIPFLPKNKLALLPDGLKREHDNFLKMLRVESEEAFLEAYNYTEAYDELRAKALEVKRPKPQEVRLTREVLSGQVSEEDKVRWKMIEQELKKKVSADSLKMWLSKPVVFVEDEKLMIFVESEFVKSHIERNLKEKVEAAVKEIVVPAKSIEVKVYEEEGR